MCSIHVCACYTIYPFMYFQSLLYVPLSFILHTIHQYTIHHTYIGWAGNQIILTPVKTSSTSYQPPINTENIADNSIVITTTTTTSTTTSPPSSNSVYNKFDNIVPVCLSDGCYSLAAVPIGINVTVQCTTYIYIFKICILSRTCSLTYILIHHVYTYIHLPYTVYYTSLTESTVIILTLFSIDTHVTP